MVSNKVVFGNLVCFNMCTDAGPRHIKPIVDFSPGAFWHLSRPQLIKELEG